ncbi:MAG: hypothetical protein IKD44_06160 [Lentisphaeria bacterium]|nr:hypothetical protein [Lentisphaeria bacterium]
MKKPNAMKDCYGSFNTSRSCAKCIYRRSCALYTGTGRAIDRNSGLVSFDNTVDLWYPAPDSCIPGYGEERDLHSEMVRYLSQMLKWIMKLDSYTLGIVAEIIAPSEALPGGVTVAHLAKLRKCTRQAMHEKMLYAVAQFPELGPLFQTALRRVGNLKSKFQSYSRKKRTE